MKNKKKKAVVIGPKNITWGFFFKEDQERFLKYYKYGTKRKK